MLWWVPAPGGREGGRENAVQEIRRASQIAEASALRVLIANRVGSIAESADQLAALIAEIGSPAVGASYDPSEVAASGGSPFYGEIYRGRLRRYLGHVDLKDVVADPGEQVALGMGNSEVMEIVSSLRCRSYAGLLCLHPRGRDIQGAIEEFSGILERI